MHKLCTILHQHEMKIINQCPIRIEYHYYIVVILICSLSSVANFFRCLALDRRCVASIL